MRVAIEMDHVGAAMGKGRPLHGADVRFSPNYFRSTSNNRRFRRARQLPYLTQSGHTTSMDLPSSLARQMLRTARLHNFLDVGEHASPIHHHPPRNVPPLERDCRRYQKQRTGQFNRARPVRKS